ncbi:hypothetical protein F5879DRAFT_1003864 [Lentinula edodes]|nr:hypothetical protein F5879DRAFT_1003864 [Lentinula edodes]
MSCHPLHVFRSLSPDTFPDPSDIHQLSEPPIFQTAVPSQPPHTPLPHSHFSGFAQVSPYTWSPISTPSLYPGQSSSQTYPRQAWSQYEYLQAQSQVHSTSGAHQSSTTSASASSSAAQSTNTRKRVSRASQGTRNVHVRTSASNKENPNGTSASSSSSTFPATPSGAGPMPSISAKTPPPAHPTYARENIFRSMMQKEAPANSGATDVWFFISPSSNQDAPVDQLLGSFGVQTRKVGTLCRFRPCEGAHQRA